MKDNIRSFFLPLAAFSSFLAVGTFVSGQTPAQRAASSIDSRRENMNQSMENDRIRAGQEEDKKVQKTKEERTKLVNEAFRDLQLVHNEIITFLTAPTATDEGVAKNLAIRAKVAATSLRDNLVLPGERKAQKNKKEQATVAVGDELLKIKDLIKSFVKNINLSPKDPSAGAQAGRDLDEVISLSKKIAPETEPSSKP